MTIAINNFEYQNELSCLHMLWDFWYIMLSLTTNEKAYTTWASKIVINVDDLYELWTLNVSSASKSEHAVMQVKWNEQKNSHFPQQNQFLSLLLFRSLSFARHEWNREYDTLRMFTTWWKIQHLQLEVGKNPHKMQVEIVKCIRIENSWGLFRENSIQFRVRRRPHRTLVYRSFAF